MRLAIWLSRALPCSFTERLRNASVSSCMRMTWH